jgi:bifunctional ADP-heptose synthase (sugar kinase/adenylyltransferase)
MIELNKVKDYKVLFVGDGIVDEYRYVKPRGKAIKAQALSVQALRTEEFDGGVWAAANHARSLCSTVHCLHRPQQMRNVYYVEETYNQKLFQVHSMESGRIADAAIIRDYDLVVVTDFGHGTMTKELIEQVSREARYLAVNVQTNSMNYGFNLVNKYQRAHFVVIDELEARLAAVDNVSPIEDVILNLGYRKIIVTMGANGAVGFDGAFERQKSVAGNIVDTIGAGDAFLAVTAPFAAAGASMKDLLRIGNAAGALKCAIVGHRKSVDRESLRAYLNV